MVLIFLTGAVVLALEVLSSRIMTPYFGVSLYIWAGILSITLTFLAVGYFLGGRISKRMDLQGQRFVFFAMPVLAALAILISTIVYPFIFPALARTDLVLGSFAASLVLLAVPLVCLSAMNPLLISLRAGSEREGDGGAGVVLFVSTAGSVVGVLVTAFMLIPGFNNFEAVLWLGVALCLFVLVSATRIPDLVKTQRRRLIVGAAVVGAMCAAVIGGQDRFFKLLAYVGPSNIDVAILAEYSSVFGNIKIANVSARGGASPPVKIYIQDGMIQNRSTQENISVSVYTYVLDRLAAVFAPQAKTAVVLGLGAGFVPKYLKERGLDVSVVEINAQSVLAARDYFAFDTGAFDVEVTDARTYVRRCTRSFDVAVVDLFQGDSTPDYLMTAEFFSDLRRCLKPDGMVAMNAFFDDNDETPNLRLLATVASAFGTVLRFQMEGGNAFVVGLGDSTRQPAPYDLASIPDGFKEVVYNTLQSGRRVPAAALRGYPKVTDRQNQFSTLLASSRMAYRRWLAEALPARLLVN